MRVKVLFRKNTRIFLGRGWVLSSLLVSVIGRFLGLVEGWRSMKLKLVGAEKFDRWVCFSGQNID